MSLETRTLPQEAFDLLAAQDHILPLDPERQAHAQKIFRQARETANAAGRETTHLDDLNAMVTALGLQIQVPQNLVEQTVATLHRQCLPKVNIIEGTVETLAKLDSQNYRIGIISNAAYSPFLTWTLEHFELLHFFENIVVSADVGVRKPSPEIFRIALEQFDLAPIDVVYVGDDFQKDILAAKRFGTRAIWFRPDDTLPLSGERAAADAIVSELTQIPNWVDQWNSGTDPEE